MLQHGVMSEEPLFVIRVVRNDKNHRRGLQNVDHRRLLSGYGECVREYQARGIERSDVVQVNPLNYCSPSPPSSIPLNCPGLFACTLCRDATTYQSRRYVSALPLRVATLKLAPSCSQCLHAQGNRRAHRAGGCFQSEYAPR